MYANSSPAAPPPMIAARSGAVSLITASRYVKTTLPSTSTPGIAAGREPVATMTFEASMRSPPTAIARPPSSVASPWSSVTPCLRKRPMMPLPSRSTTPRLRLSAAP